MKIYSQRLVISSFARNSFFFFFDTLLLEILEKKFHIYVAGADFEYIYIIQEENYSFNYI